jgi:hypothetical protein
MVEATISRARLRDPACLGRYPPGLGAMRRRDRADRFVRSALVDAASIDVALPSRPRATGPRPEDGDLMASTI